MRKFRQFLAKSGAAALAVSMAFQVTVFAEPMDELNDIMEAQTEQGSKSLLSEFLGLSELGDAIDERGFQIQTDFGLTEETISTLGLEGLLTPDSHMNFNLQVDKELKQWLLEAEAGLTAESLLEGGLYGDADTLALTLPQFFAGALSLHSGNFAEQYANSELAQVLGEVPENLPDIDMSFYPDEEALDAAGKSLGSLQEEMEDLAENLEDKAQAEKREDGDSVIYTVTMATEDIMEVYGTFMDWYMSLFLDSGLVASYGAEDIEYEIERMLLDMEYMIGESVAVEFHVKDNLVQSIHYELEIDTSAFEAAYAEQEYEMSTEVVVEELAPAGTADDAVLADDAEVYAEDAAAEAEAAAAETAEEAEVSAAEMAGDVMDTSEVYDVPVMESNGFVGTVSYDIAYIDPADVSKGMTASMVMTDLQGTEFSSFSMEFRSETDGTVQTYTVFMEMTAEDQVVYSGTPITATFDSQTGDLDASFRIEENGEAVELKLDSTFSQLEEGRGFVWTIDELSMDAMGESMGMTAEILVSSDPGEIMKPQEERVLFEMTQGGLLDLTNEVMTNANLWMAQFTPQSVMESEGQEDVQGMTEAEGLAETEALMEGGNLAEDGNLAETEGLVTE